MVNFLKTVGYYSLATLIVVAIATTGAFLWVISAVLGLLFAGILVITLIAVCIKEYCETAPTDPRRGIQEREPQRPS
jgi:hypothetical protein